MAKTLREITGDSTGQRSAPTVPLLPEGSGEQGVLYPSEISITEHVRWLLRYSMKQVGVRIWGGDEEQATTNLARTLDARSGKHFAVSWLDYCVEVGGTPFALYIVNVLCDRWGLNRTTPKHPELLNAEHMSALSTRVEELSKIAAELAAEVRMANERVQR